MTAMASSADDRRGVAEMLAGVMPALLFGLRVATAVSLALFLAFYLQLETPSWAGTSACVVCQTVVGSSLLKGVFRMIGTMIGAVVALVLTGAFPENRAGFLFALLLWASGCSLVATLLRNFVSYAAVLAGFTPIIIAGTSIPAPDQIFDIAVNRASEICVGIVCGTLVIALTDLGNSPRRLAALLSQLIAETASHLVRILADAGLPHSDSSEQRRVLIARTATLNPVIGDAAGESPELLQRQFVLHAAMNGLFRALSGARIVETHLRSAPAAETRRDARMILTDLLPGWAATPSAFGRASAALDRDRDISILRRLLRRRADDLSMRLTLDAAASVAAGLAVAANGLTLLNNPAEARDLRPPFGFFVADWLSPLVNALRTFLGVGAVMLFWIVTAWPNGLFAITFSAITVMNFAPMPGVKRSALSWSVGAMSTAVIVAVVKFALLPNHESFLAFSAMIAIALVPLGALSTVPVLTPYFLPATVLFTPLLAPTNEIAYDTQAYFNTASALLIGCCFGITALALLPPVPARIQSQRLLDLSIRDLRRLAGGRRDWTLTQWENRFYARLAAMPEEAEPIQRAYLMSTLSVGIQIIRLQRLARNSRIKIHLPDVLAGLAAGNVAELREVLRRVDRNILSISESEPGASVRLRARSALLAIGEAVDRHRPYFGGGRS
jgi:uncharacterized membrane protein YccC